MIFGIGDLHLTRYVWSDRKDIEGDSIQAFGAIAMKIVEMTTDEPKHLLLAGDIFDKKYVDGYVMKHFSNIIHYLDSNGVKVYYVQGNHDNSLEPLPSAIQKLYEPIPIHLDGEGVVEIDGLKVLGIDYGTPEEMKDKLNAVKEPVDIVVMHCAFQHLLPFEGAYALSMSDIPENYKHVFVGDIHVTDISGELPSGGTVISPGPIHACNVEQSEPKGFFQLTKGKEVDPEFHEIDYRRIFRYKVAVEDDLVTLDSDLVRWCDIYSESEYEPIVEIRYAAEFTEQITKIMATHTGYKYFAKRTSSSAVAVDDTNVVYERATLLSCLPALMQEDDPDYVFTKNILSGKASEIIEAELEEIL
jgi:DNA repair exonuclease SbcCD nuclease subunit